MAIKQITEDQFNSYPNEKNAMSSFVAKEKQGFSIPQDIRFRMSVWKCTIPGLDNLKFVGGYLSDEEIQFQSLENGRMRFMTNILKLGSTYPSFFGIELHIFRILRQISFGDWSLLADLEQNNNDEFRSSNFAFLRDGSMTGPLEGFEFIGIEEF